ncbi:MAG: hypothetical protein SGI87_05130, partial [Flavobacteriales bacterium]|nr:hypothetical protein [Flavobacteriales bacterium]
MSKIESNSQHVNLLFLRLPRWYKYLTCQRSKAIHNTKKLDDTRMNVGTNILHVKDRKQFTT